MIIWNLKPSQIDKLNLKDRDIDEVTATWKNNKDSEKFDLKAFEKENPLLFKKYQSVMPGAMVLRFNKNIGDENGTGI